MTAYVIRRLFAVVPVMAVVALFVFFLLRFAPGVYTTAPFVHEYWEEVFLVSGDLIVGNDEAGQTNAAFVSLLASCRLHDIEPWGYLRDLLCLLPSWSISRVIELAERGQHCGGDRRPLLGLAVRHRREHSELWPAGCFRGVRHDRNVNAAQHRRAQDEPWHAGLDGLRAPGRDDGVRRDHEQVRRATVYGTRDGHIGRPGEALPLLLLELDLDDDHADRRVFGEQKQNEQAIRLLERTAMRSSTSRGSSATRSRASRTCAVRSPARPSST